MSVNPNQPAPAVPTVDQKAVLPATPTPIQVKEKSVLYVTQAVVCRKKSSAENYLQNVRQLTEMVEKAVHQTVGYKAEGAAQMTVMPCSDRERVYVPEYPHQTFYADMLMFCMTQTLVLR